MESELEHRPSDLKAHAVTLMLFLFWGLQGIFFNDDSLYIFNTSNTLQNSNRKSVVSGLILKM